MNDLFLQNNNWQDVLARINVEAPLNVIFTGDVIGNANILLTKWLPDGSRQPNNVILIDCTVNANIAAGLTNVILIGDVISGNANIVDGVLTLTTTIVSSNVGGGNSGVSNVVLIGDITSSNATLSNGILTLNTTLSNAYIQSILNNAITNISVIGDVVGYTTSVVNGLATVTTTMSSSISNILSRAANGLSNIIVIGDVTGVTTNIAANGLATVTTTVSSNIANILSRAANAITNVIIDGAVTSTNWAFSNSVLTITTTSNISSGTSNGLTNVILTGWVIASNSSITNNVITINTIFSNTAVYVSNIIAGNGITISNAVGVNATPTISLTPTGVAAGTYGNSTYVGQVTLDTLGRVTQASNVKIAVGGLGGGRQSIYLPAGALKPANINGCQPLVSYSYGVGKPDAISLNFSGTANNSAFFSIAMPKNWDLGNVKYRYIWTYREDSAVANNYNVLWSMSATAFSDGDSLNASMGTEVTVLDDAGLTGNANIICVTAESANVVIAGSPQENDFTVFEVKRIATNASDNYTGNAIFLGVKLFVGTTSLTED